MDSQFTFPKKAAISRPIPSNPNPSANRQSNALRASVLDAALQLGIGNNNAVAHWMFNEPLEEEEENLTSPGLTSGSTVASDESFPSPFIVVESVTSLNDPYLDQEDSKSTKISKNGGDTFLALRSENPTFGSGHNKLRKRPVDGYVSDAGYFSEGMTKNKEKEKAKQKNSVTRDLIQASSKDKEKKERMKEEKVRVKELKERAKEEKEREKRERKEVKALASRSTKNSSGDLEKDSGYTTGHETDGGDSSKLALSKSKSSKSSPKSKSSDPGYETDDGYLSSALTKKKPRFFRLGSKPKSDSQGMPDDGKDSVPPVPAIPTMSLPIAKKFAKTLTPSRAISQGETALVTEAELESLGSQESERNAERMKHFLFVDTITTSFSFQHDGAAQETGILNDRSSEGGRSSSASTSASPLAPFQSKQPSGRPIAPAIITSSDTPQSNPSSPSGFPKISYPVTRSASPHVIPPRAQIEGSVRARHVPTPLSLSPISPHTHDGRPIILPKPRSPIESNNVFQSHSTASLTDSPYVLVTPLGPSSPNANGRRSRPSNLEAKLSSEHLALALPRVLVDYDLPPPSPPPTGPLPNLPPCLPQACRSSLANSYIPDETLDLPKQRLPLIRRGREATFPARPIFPGHNRDTVGAGLESRVRVRRYQDLYSIHNPVRGWQEESQTRHGRGKDATMPGISVEVPSDDEDDMRDVLDRFSYQDDDADNSLHIDRVIHRSLSLHVSDSSAPVEDDDRSTYPDEEKTAGRSTMYNIEHLAGERNSMWNGSIHSRVSFFDEEKSEGTRERLIRRVEAMSEGTSGGADDAVSIRYVPPVPKLAEVLGKGRTHSNARF